MHSCPKMPVSYSYCNRLHCRTDVIPDKAVARTHIHILEGGVGQSE